MEGAARKNSGLSGNSRVYNPPNSLSGESQGSRNLWSANHLFSYKLFRAVANSVPCCLRRLLIIRLPCFSRCRHQLGSCQLECVSNIVVRTVACKPARRELVRLRIFICPTPHFGRHFKAKKIKNHQAHFGRHLSSWWYLAVGPAAISRSV